MNEIPKDWIKTATPAEMAQAWMYGTHFHADECAQYVRIKGNIFVFPHEYVPDMNAVARALFGMPAPPDQSGAKE